MNKAKHYNQFSTNSLPTSDRFEFWYSLMNQRGTAMTLDVSSPNQFTGRAKSTVLGNFVVSHLVNSPVTVIRGKEHIRQDSELFYLIHLPLNHGLTLVESNNVHKIPAGSLTIINTEFPVTALQEGRNLISLRIPAKAIPDIKIEHPFITFKRHQLPYYLQQLLVNAAYSSFSTPLNGQEQAFFEQELIIAITLLLNGQQHTNSHMKQFFFDQICQLVTNNQQGTLDIAQIAAKLKISKPYIQKILSAHQVSFRQLVANHRLQTSLSNILSKNNHITRLSDIANMAGFKNETHFSNSFKKHFKCTPLKFYQMFN